MTTPTFNKFKSTTIYGNFTNVDHTDSSGAILTSASAYFQRNLTISGNLTSSGIINGNKLYYNGVDISSNFLQKDISGNISISGNLTSSGIINGKKLYYNNVDIDLTYVSNTTLTSYASIFQPVFKGNIDLTVIDPIASAYTFSISNSTGIINMNTYNNGSYPVKIKASNFQLSKNNGTNYYDVLTTNTGLTSASLSSYALTSSLSNYATTSSLSNYALTSSLSNYALTSSLSNYALTSSLSNYALTSSLSNYVTSASLSSSYVSTVAGVDINIRCNDRQNFPTTTTTRRGLGLYWNRSGGSGETSIICFGEGANGGCDFWANGNSLVPTQMVEFLPSGATFSTAVYMKQLVFTSAGTTSTPYLTTDAGNNLILSTANNNGLQFSTPSGGSSITANGTGLKVSGSLQVGANSTPGTVVLQIGNGSTDYTNLYVNGTTLNISQNVSTGNLKCTGLLDSTNASGTNGQVPIANGTGGWIWSASSTSTNSVFGTQQILK